MMTQETEVLIVDDEPVNLKMLFAFLKREGFKVRLADSGAAALKVLATACPDIILLDVMMHELDGFEVCRRIKADPATADIPVIFMTALDNLEDKVTGFKVGGVDYITKPFEHVEVLARIRTHVALRRRERELQEALAEIKTLSGILPICSYCKRVRNDEGYWQQVEQYISEHTDALFSHGMCIDCYRKEIGSVKDDDPALP